MVALQDPTATYVAGFRAWLKLGYCVQRGCTSHICVWAPCPPSRKKLQAWRDAGAVPADKPRTYFRLQAVFSQAQVEPLPPPAQPAPLEPPSAELEGDSLTWAQQPLERLAGELGYRVAYRPLQRGHGGSCDPTAKILTVNDAQSVNAQVSVTCHELAHALVQQDRQDGDPALGYTEEELVAESVVFWWPRREFGGCVSRQRGWHPSPTWLRRAGTRLAAPERGHTRFRGRRTVVAFRPGRRRGGVRRA